MSRPEPTNIAASVVARLRQLRTGTPDGFETLLIRYALERFLYRLSRSRHSDRFLLKGAMLFPLWLGDRVRSTRDLDLMSFGPCGADTLASIFGEICSVPVEDDGLLFRVETLRVEENRLELRYGGLRVRFRAALGKSDIPVLVDIGFGDAVPSVPEPANYPTLLAFPAPVVRPYPAESVIAEKFQAMVVLGAINSRLKDYHDIAFLAGRFSFRGASLAKALEATFARRSTELPDAVPPALTAAYHEDPIHWRDWGTFLRKNGIPEEGWTLSDACAQIERFLMPVVGAVRDGQAPPDVWEDGSWSTGSGQA